MKERNKDIVIAFMVITLVFSAYSALSPSPLLVPVKPTLMWEIGHFFCGIYGGMPASIPIDAFLILLFVSWKLDGRYKKPTRKETIKRLEAEIKNLAIQKRFVESERVRIGNKLLRASLVLDKIYAENPGKYDKLREYVNST